MDCRAGQGANAVSINAVELAAASARVFATFADRRFPEAPLHRSLQPAAEMRLSRSLPFTFSTSTRGLLPYFNSPLIVSP